MKQVVKVSFYLKKDEVKTDGTCPVIGWKIQRNCPPVSNVNCPPVSFFSN